MESMGKSGMGLIQVRTRRFQLTWLTCHNQDRTSCSACNKFSPDLGQDIFSLLRYAGYKVDLFG